MNIFQDETRELLEKFVSKDWAEQLCKYIDMETFKSIGKKVSILRQTSMVYPEPQNVFKSLKYPFEKVKVVIIGQDPYYNGNADGLAFSCRNSLSPSLSMILNAIWKDHFPDKNLAELNLYRTYINNKNNWNLEYLAEQGVLLYNPTLTVESGKAGSHKGIWTQFSDAVFQSLNNKKDLVYLIWGSYALNCFNRNNIYNNQDRLVLTNEHPAAASYRKEEWKCYHFTECNKFLKERNINEIEWLQR